MQGHAPQGIRRGLYAGIALAACLFAAPGVARAEDMAAAEALFREARELMDSGKIPEACQKFAESQRLDPSPGTLVNLARCHTKQGKHASAWAEYLAAARAAQTAHRDDLVEEAKARADEVAPLVSHLTLTIAKQLPGLSVTRNGEPVDLSSMGSKLPVDPGRYTIKTDAPGYTPFSGEVVVEGGGDAKSLAIPELLPKPPEAKPGPQRASASGDKDQAAGGSAPIAAYVVGGIGIASTAAGLVFGGLASSEYDEATKGCTSKSGAPSGCSPSAMSSRDSAQTKATVANVLVGVGVGAIGVGIVLLLVHDPGTPAASSAGLHVGLGPNGAHADLRGSF